MPPTSRKRPAPWGYADLYVSLGSNLGDREANIRAALTAMNRSFGRYVRLSSTIETEPWGFESANKFLNCCALYRVRRWSADLWLDSVHILGRLKEIEKRLGRELPPVLDEECTDAEGKRIYSDRPIDIDILLYGDLRTKGSLITVPHPRMKERDFVMRPLLEIVRPSTKRLFPEIFR